MVFVIKNKNIFTNYIDMYIILYYITININLIFLNVTCFIISITIYIYIFDISFGFSLSLFHINTIFNTHNTYNIPITHLCSQHIITAFVNFHFLSIILRNISEILSYDIVIFKYIMLHCMSTNVNIRTKMTCF